VRPLKLSLSGFTCFREATEVSFEDLQLFAISGVTGAGKSTLLDAITYALYGQTARLGTRLGETLFSPNLDKLTVQLTFRVGGETYRVARVSERKGARGPKNETRLERLGENAQWRQFSESEKLKDADRKLEEIVGLTYDNFTRAVLLPQGAFDRFLHAKPGERTNLLRDLLSLSITAEMQKRAGQTARDAELRAKAIEERLNHDYAQATPERRRELNAELGALSDEQKALLAARGTLQERVQGLRALQELFGERAGVQRRLAELKAQEDQIKRDRQLLAQAKDADKLLPHLSDLEAHRSKAQGLAAQQERVMNELKTAKKAFEDAQTALSAAEQDAARLPELAARMERLAEARVLFGLLKSRRGTLALAKETQQPYSDDTWDALQGQVQGLPALERARSEVTDTQMRRNQARTRVHQTEAQLAEAGAVLQRLEGEGKDAKARRESAEAAYTEAARVAPAAALRPHLHVGEACPVCEQTVTVLPPPVTGNLSALQKARDEAAAEHERLKEVYTEARTTLKTLESRLKTDTEEMSRAEADLTRRNAQLNTLAQQLGEGDPSRLRAWLTAAQRALLAGLAGNILEKTQGLDPEAAHAELTRERTRLTAAQRNAQSAFHAAQRTLDRLSADAAGLSERLSEAREAQTQAERVFAELLSRTPFADPDALRAAALPAARQQALAERSERYAHDLEQLTRQDVGLEARLAGRTLEPGALEAALAEQARTETRLGVVQNRLGALKGELVRLEEQLETAKRLRAERAELEKIASLYGVLNRDLMTNNFPAYMLERVQDDLAQRASDILKSVTDGRYDLFFRGDEYVVLDAWTGSERSARTLSGGESFITSLALALALSDTLAGSTSLGALFLDEGFGTLDAETLEGVAKVLESLTAHGRMVGVITHVAALTERLPDRLVVKKGPEGSVVTWE
jgi:exonuclease SbcC